MLREITATRTPRVCDACCQPIEVGSPAWLDPNFMAIDISENDAADYGMGEYVENPKVERIVISSRHWLHRACASPRVWRDKSGRVHREAEEVSA